MRSAASLQRLVGDPWTHEDREAWSMSLTGQLDRQLGAGYLGRGPALQAR